MEKFEGIKKQLSELATILNEFKSESVQLKIVDYLLSRQPERSQDIPVDEAKEHAARNVKHVAKAKNSQNGSSEKRKKSTAGTGAQSTLMQLTDGDFFKTSRTINDIIEHCRHNLARTFKANEFSGKLARLVRKGDLIRKKNSENQYEYSKP